MHKTSVVNAMKQAKEEETGDSTDFRDIGKQPQVK
jgi:hypothetical protein